jgi:integrase
VLVRVPRAGLRRLVRECAGSLRRDEVGRDGGSAALSLGHDSDLSADRRVSQVTKWRYVTLQSISKDELRALLTIAKASRERDWLMILVTFWHGLRASEVVGITRDDIADGYLTVRRLKGSNKTIQALVDDPDPLLNERAGLFEYSRKFLGNQKLFDVSRVQFFRLVQRYSRSAGLPEHKRHPHMLKHSIAMQSIHSAGIENVRQHLGHKSIASTGAYLKVSDSDATSAVVKAVKV